MRYRKSSHQIVTRHRSFLPRASPGLVVFPFGDVHFHLTRGRHEHDRYLQNSSLQSVQHDLF